MLLPHLAIGLLERSVPRIGKPLTCLLGTVSTANGRVQVTQELIKERETRVTHGGLDSGKEAIGIGQSKTAELVEELLHGKTLFVGKTTPRLKVFSHHVSC